MTIITFGTRFAVYGEKQQNNMSNKENIILYHYFQLDENYLFVNVLAMFLILFFLFSEFLQISFHEFIYYYLYIIYL